MANGVRITPGWYSDPAGRHELRYWDGSGWTAHVTDSGAVTADPLRTPLAQPVAAAAAEPGGRTGRNIGGVLGAAAIIVAAVLVAGDHESKPTTVHLQLTAANEVFSGHAFDPAVTDLGRWEDSDGSFVCFPSAYLGTAKTVDAGWPADVRQPWARMIADLEAQQRTCASGDEEGFKAAVAAAKRDNAAAKQAWDTHCRAISPLTAKCT